MARTSPLERLVRQTLLIVLVALAAAAVYLWMSRGGDEAQTFARIYQASVSQATANVELVGALGLPLRTSESDAHYEFYQRDGRRHVRFRYPLQGPRAGAIIEGDAMELGRNWLIVSLVARFPEQNAQIDLSPNINT